MVFLQRQFLYCFRRLEWDIAHQRQHNHSASICPNQLHAGLQRIGWHDGRVGIGICRYTHGYIDHIERHPDDG